MGCGCGKGKSGGPLPQTNHRTAAAPTAARVAVYEVVKDGAVVLSTTTPSSARSEAKRVGGSVRVTSRPVTKELVS